MNEAYNKYVDKTVRTTWLKKWTGDFLKKLDEISDMGREEIKSCCEDYKKKYIEEIKARSLLRAKKQGKELQETSWMNSAANNLSHVRNANGTRLKGDKAVARRHNFGCSWRNTYGTLALAAARCRVIVIFRHVRGASRAF